MRLSLSGLLFAVLALASQLVFGALAVSEDASASEREAIAALAVLCHQRVPSDPSPQRPHHHHGDPALPAAADAGSASLLALAPQEAPRLPLAPSIRQAWLCQPPARGPPPPGTPRPFARAPPIPA